MTGRSSSVTRGIWVPCSVKLADEADHGLADLSRPLLLGPVPAAAKQDRVAQPGRGLAQPRQRLVRADDEVPVPGDEQGGNGDRRVMPGGRELPVAVDVAIPVQRLGEASVSVLRDEDFYVLAGQPRRQRRGLRRLGAYVQEPAALGYDRGRTGGGPVSGSGAQQPGER